MNKSHLTASELQYLVEGTSEKGVRTQIQAHLAECAFCRERHQRAALLEAMLRNLVRAPAPKGLATKVYTKVDWQLAQELRRRTRLPYVALAMISSVVLALWFGLQVVFALYDNGTLDLFSILARRPDLLSTYSPDALYALFETLPLLEITLAALATMIVIVLTQQLADSVPQRPAHSK